MEEVNIYKIMVIWPNGTITDETITEVPETNHRITIQGKNYRIVESHVSAVPERWEFILTLSY